ncbi:basement membrane-specific heparan sulfate proteoglycan core protein isoform X2 [Trichomycterus rosablanca]|uniref:basement membrane-specific heparan sulfate proteoglycan core protein isoform X2 n=1 Tax=Trichomycterus rosablanca TaxID=2290929 RepID=UPI002F35D50F
MGTRTGVRKLSAFLIALVLGSHLITVVESSKVWGEVPFPEDLETIEVPRAQRYLDDDEDFAADEASGDYISGEEDGSTPDPTMTVYYRALVNFTDSVIYGPELDNIESSAFLEISAAVIDTLESEYQRIPGSQTISVVLIKKIGKDVFVELDVGSDDNQNEGEIRAVLYSVVKEGTIGSYVTSAAGFSFRHLGELKPSQRECTDKEFTCQSGECILLEFYCDKRSDCSDNSDELTCPAEATPIPSIAYPKTTPEPTRPSVPGPCRVDQARCQSGECISRDYLCDGGRDCSDGSDESQCGTSSPCEPNEFRCKNGHCALKLWRCDGDNDCNDNSDEMDCPVKKPGDACAPHEFLCHLNHTCIPASYQCDEEPDCEDTSDEYRCAPPTVIIPPQESITASRGQTVTFTCTATGVPVPMITWRLNWGHIPTSNRFNETSENGRGMLVIRDVKDSDQGAYTCEAINAKGLVFAIPDGVLTLSRTPSDCPDGQFRISGHCVSCFCAGISRHCQTTGRYRNQISIRFNEEENFKGVNVSFPSRPSSPLPLSSTQLLIRPEEEEFQLVDLSRRFLDLESYWTLPHQFLGSKVDSYGGYLRYKVSYSLQRDGFEPLQKPDVILKGNGRRLVYQPRSPTSPNVKNQREIKFTEEHWQHSSGQPVTREDLLMTLASLESISIRTIYDNRMASVGLSDIVMDTTSREFSLQGLAKDVEECSCPPGYSGLSCESCSFGFERVPGGRFLGTCAGCNCHGHANACDPVSGHCLSCQHNTEGPQCNQCRPGYFGDPSRGRPDDCKPCPCPYTESSRRFSNTCLLDVDLQATCDACKPGYTGRRCERCASGFTGNPLQPSGQCVLISSGTCDNRGTINSSSRPCSCKANVAGASCDECKPGSFHLSADNPEGCMQCFCMGVTKQCASSTWTRDQVRGGINGQLFSLSNGGNTRTITDGISQRGGAEVVYRSFADIPNDIYYWVLPENFRGDKVTAYGGELRYKIRYELSHRSLVIDSQPDVILQGNGIFLEHYSQNKPLPQVPATFTVSFRESAWRRADGQPCTREHLLMALADVAVFMIRATYADNMAESSLSDIQMDIALPHSTGNERALEVEECACPVGYRGPSCQECDVGYTRTGSGLYLGTCERCECHGHASSCDPETGACLRCQHNTAGPRCESCLPGFYGSPATGGCRPCPCLGPTGFNEAKSCYLDSDGQPTCSDCPLGYTGRRCESCAPGYTGNPEYGQSCTTGAGNLICQSCDQKGSEGCSSNGACRCKTNVEGPSCSSCKPGTFYLGAANKDGCLACFCMGVTQQCSSSSLYRDVVSTVFTPGNTQGFALVNRQRSSRINSGFSVELSIDGSQLSYTAFDQQSHEPHYWQLPSAYQGNKVSAYGGKLKYTITYVPGPRGTPIDDVDVQILGNDILLVARQPWERRPGTRETRSFEIIFREEFWQRADGMPATREHLLMLLADLDDILIRATYYTAMRSSSISGVSMDIAVPNYTGLAPAPEVEQCSCPPGYQGLSCQDCAPGYSRTGEGLYLGHCELCECNGHSDSCHPETGICTSCQHNTAGERCDLCAPGFFGDASVGTPEDCQPCACPHTNPENQFSPTCESLGNGDYRCTACQPGYTGQYCERCERGYVGDPQNRVRCQPYNAAASLVVKVYPERIQVAQGHSVTLRCQGSGPTPHYFYWTREDSRPISGSAERRRQGEELHFASVQPTDAGVYICTCRNQLSTNRSRAEIVIASSPSKPIEVFIEEPKSRRVNPGATVSFICTAKSQFPAYTLVWTRQGNRKLPDRAMDFNGILTIQNVRPEDAGAYVCTGSNMFAMDEGTAVLYIAAGEGVKPTVSIYPSTLTVQQGKRAEFRCSATGSPRPSVEWTGSSGRRIGSNAVIRDGVLTFPSVDRSVEGDYTCRALNIHGEHAARVVLYVHSASAGELVKPTVTINPPSLTVQRGQRAEFRCTATGKPSPSVEWTGSSGRRIGSNAFIREGVLTFPSVDRSDEGEYTCRALNAHGEHAARVVLYVHGTPSTGVEVGRLSVTIHPPVVTVKQGQRAEFHCTATGNPTPTVEWTGGTGNRISSNAIIQGGVLTFPSVERSDEGDYVCRAFNTQGQHTARAILYVHSASLPHVQVSPQRVEIYEGETLQLYCRAGGMPSPTLSWKKRGGTLPSQAISPHGFHQIKSNSLDALHSRTEELQARTDRTDYGTLIIPNVKIEDAGTYLCIGTNAEGSSEARIEVTVLKDSDLTIHSSAGSVVEGGTLELNCNVLGNPSSPVTWSRADGRRLSHSHQIIGRQLRILRASPEDSGEYICRVDEGPNSREASIFVTVTSGSEPPDTTDVTIYPSAASVVKGSTLVLNCNIPGQTSPSVQWSRADGRLLPSNHQVIGTELHILRAIQEDAGEYICRVNEGPKIFQASIIVTITPDSTNFSSSAVTIYPSVGTVVAGDSLELNCNVPGHLPVYWSRADGRPLSSNHQVRGTRLRIVKASREDSGEYICRVQEGPNIHQASVTVSVSDPGSSDVTIYPSTGTVVAGDSLELNCNVPAHLPVYWSRADGRPLSSNHQVTGTRLRILKASREDSGEYICRAQEGPNIHQASVTVSVSDPGSSAVTIDPSVGTVVAGDSLELNCNVPAHLPVYWSRADGRPLSSNHQVRGTRLRIVKASREDTGEYICRVREGPNIHQATVTVSVSDPGSSDVTIYPSVGTVVAGDSLELNCNVPGHLPVYWSRADGRPLSSNHQVRGTWLRIVKASREDSGEYICRVQEGPNIHQASVTVSVSDPGSSAVTIYPSVGTVVAGDSLELNCNVPAHLPVYWSRADGRPLSSNHQVTGTRLRILKASREDSGEYICRAQEGPNIHQASVTVSVSDPGSSAVTIYPSVGTVGAGDSLELNCNVPAHLPVYWSRADGRPLSSNHQVRGTRLRIVKASREDSGEYICRVQEGPNIHQASVTVSVSDPGSSAVTIYPSVGIVVEGEALELKCNVPGHLSSSVHWSRADNRHLSSNHQVIGTQLRILRASQEDSGIYVCRVYEGSDIHEASVPVTVTSESTHAGSSDVIMYPSVGHVVEGEMLELYCYVPGNLSPSVVWSRADGRPLSSNHQDLGTRLRILKASQGDSGEYICRVQSGTKILQGAVSVIVSDPDSSKINIYPSVGSVVEGETLDLNCNVPSHLSSSVQWTRADGRPLSSNHRVIGTQLRILQASQADSGDYTCMVYEGQNVHKASVPVTITSQSIRLRGPIISIEPHSAAVKKGESTRFRCSVHSGAKPIFLEWKQANNQPLPDNVRVSEDGSVITITDAQPKNHGAYHCVARNKFGITDSIVSLIVRESPRATVTPTGPVRVRVGDPINLECQTAGEPQPSVTWHKLDNNRKNVLMSPVPMESNAVLQILVARPEDHGTYVCTAQNNQGKTETKVDVIVEGGPQVPTVPIASVKEPLIIVEEGGTATLHCDAHGFPRPTITWSKLRSPLPWRHKIANGSLILPNVGRQDSGQYICNATNPMGTSEATVALDVETPPYTSTMPDDVTIRVGEVIRLQCLAHGTPPLRYEWSKVDGTMPGRAVVKGGDLQINLAEPSDAGNYRCVVSNKVGRSEAIARVSVRSPLSVRVSPQVEVKALGSAVEFTCSASGGPEITLEWLKEGGALPYSHHIKDGVLRIENLEKSNEGIYICRATTLFGQAQDSAKLTIQALPKVMINVRTSVQTVMVGNAVEFECQAEGEPKPTVHWSKVDGSLPSHAQVKGGILRIHRVTEADAGQYRCTATNDVGSVQSQVVLNIQSVPQIIGQPVTKEVNVGSNAVFPCNATGYPVPTITWSKKGGELPPKSSQDGHVLTVPDVTFEDAGAYVCKASNKHGSVQAATKLLVHERVMPYFSQEPLSYVKLPTIKNSYKEFKINITFRPDNGDGLILYSGMILYNGQRRTMGADFISLGLVGGRPEFRFDVGSGMATIRFPNAIKIGEFHTVQLYRNGTKGSITVDTEAPINGTSQGKFQGLDLNEELFVGGYPNYSMISKTAELSTGFVGCISQLIIQGEEVIFKDLSRSSIGVTKCPTCKDQPCQNNGRCSDSVASLYKCSCPRGFTGSNCQHLSSQHCHPESCGPDGTCINRPSGAGYDCRCHLGKYGHKCMDGTLVTTPLFDGEKSYITYPPLTNIHNDLRIEVEFKSLTDNGLMFFSGGKKMKVEDFVSLSLVDGHLEFRYELGTGQAVLRSQKRVSAGQWHRVIAERLNQDGSLKVNDEPEIKGLSPGKAQGLNIHTPMYLGGVPSMDILPKPANISILYKGCIGEVSINGKKVDLSYSFTESGSIGQCVDDSPCDRRPCLHGGTCMLTAEYEFQCLCRDGYEGERCEVIRDTCVSSIQCRNGGSCVNGHCLCTAGYTGVFCTEGQKAVGTEALWSKEGGAVNDAPGQYAAHFRDGYLVLPNFMFPHIAPNTPEMIELEINTRSADGLILWQGVAPGENGKGKDFISISLQNGQPVFSYQLGSGEAQIISRERVNDGNWHKIIAVRTARLGQIQINDRAPQHGQSKGKSIMADTKGSVYLGGAPNMDELTGGKFTSGITGCVRNLSLMNARPGEQPSRPIDLQHYAESGLNVRRCSS